MKLDKALLIADKCRDEVGYSPLRKEYYKPEEIVEARKIKREFIRSLDLKKMFPYMYVRKNDN